MVLPWQILRKKIKISRRFLPARELLPKVIFTKHSTWHRFGNYRFCSLLKTTVTGCLRRQTSSIVAKILPTEVKVMASKAILSTEIIFWKYIHGFQHWQNLCGKIHVRF